MNHQMTAPVNTKAHQITFTI